MDLYQATLPALVFVVALAVPGLSQSVWQVDATQGADAIQIAVDAASDGDLILVGPGDYNRVRIAGKGLTLIGEPALGGVQLLLFDSGEQAASVGLLELVDIGSSQSVRVEGFQLSGGSNSHPTLVVRQSAGSVVVGNVTVESAPAVSGTSYPSILVEDSDSVHLRNVSSTMSREQDPVFLIFNLDGLRVRNSKLSASGCSFVAGDSFVHEPEGWFAPGGSGIFAEDSVLQLANTRAVGGMQDFESDLYFSGGGYGLRMQGTSQAWIAGGSNATFEGAEGVTEVTPFGVVLVSSSGQAGIGAFQNAQIHAAPDVAFVEGVPGPLDAYDGESVVEGLSSLTILPEALGRASLSATTPQLGDSVQLELSGQPGAIMLPFLSLALQPPTPIAGIGALAWLDGTALALGSLALDGAGEGQLSFTIPALPQWGGQSVFWQTAQLSSAAQLSLSDPAGLVVLP